jgi:hypothetical protein
VTLNALTLLTEREREREKEREKIFYVGRLSIARWNETDAENQRSRRKFLPSAISSTINNV